MFFITLRALQKVEALEYHANLLAELQKLLRGSSVRLLPSIITSPPVRAFEEVYAAPRCSFLRR